MTEHISLIALRRHFSGEIVPEVAEHAASCDQCTARLTELEAEQQELEKAVPFETFAARVASKSQRPARSRRASIAISLAATLVLLFAVGRLMMPVESSRVKGGESVSFVVAGASGQRAVDAALETLAAGERVRIGVTAGDFHWVSVVSIDQAGVVTQIYDQALTGTQWLPGSLELTGHGLERFIVLLSGQPMPVEAVLDAARRSFEAAHGDAGKMAPLEVPAGPLAQFHRTFLKP